MIPLYPCKFEAGWPVIVVPLPTDFEISEELCRDLLERERRALLRTVKNRFGRIPSNLQQRLCHQDMPSGRRWLVDRLPLLDVGLPVWAIVGEKIRLPMNAWE